MTKDLSARTTPQLETLYNRLKVARWDKSGVSFTAHCPAHDDRKPSLRVTAADDGKILIRCMAGCDTGDVLAAIGMHKQDLFPPGGPSFAGDTRVVRKVVARYEYRDEEGITRFRVVRMEPREFYQERPDGTGGWTPGLKGIRPFPYNLDRLVASDFDVPVFLVEGEKDADRLAASGLLATTTPMGSGNWKHDYAQWFADRDVIILPDNDDAGRAYAESVTGSLVSVTRRVRTVSVPGVPPKGDVSDFLDAGGDIAAILDLAEHTAPDRAQSSPPMTVLTVCLDDVQTEPVEWIWPGIVPLGKVMVIDGDPGLGKTTVAAYIAARISTGEPFYHSGGGSPPAAVMFMTAEDGLGDTLKPRLLAAGADLRMIHALPGVPDLQHPGISRLPIFPDDIELLEQHVRLHGAKLLVVDPWMAFVADAISTANDQQMRRALSPLTMLAEKTDCTVLLIRHLNKARHPNATHRGGGSIATIGAARVGLLVAQDSADPSRRMLATIKNNLSRFAPTLQFRLADVPAAGAARVVWEGIAEVTANELLAADLEGDENRSATADAVDWLLAELEACGPNGILANEIKDRAHKAGFTENVINKAKSRAKVRPVRNGFGRGGEYVWIHPACRSRSPGMEAAMDGRHHMDGPAADAEIHGGDWPSMQTGNQMPVESTGEPCVMCSAPRLPGNILFCERCQEIASAKSEQGG